MNKPKKKYTFSRQKHKKPHLHKKVDPPFKIKTFNHSKTKAQNKLGIPLHHRSTNTWDY